MVLWPCSFAGALWRAWGLADSRRGSNLQVLPRDIGGPSALDELSMNGGWGSRQMGPALLLMDPGGLLGVRGFAVCLWCSPARPNEPRSLWLLLVRGLNGAKRFT
jgi:hypothetical protein